MSPADDTFMSGSLDNSVRLWDLRTPNCSGIMQVQGKPVSHKGISGNPPTDQRSIL